MELPLPVIPFKPTVRRLLGFLEQLLQPADIALLPSLLGQVHVGAIEQAPRVGFFRVGAEALSLFGYPRVVGLNGLPSGHHDPQKEGCDDNACGGKGQLVALPSLEKSVAHARWTSYHWFMVQMPLQISGQSVGCLVTPRAVLLEAFHHDAVQVSPHGGYLLTARQPWRTQASAL